MRTLYIHPPFFKVFSEENDFYPAYLKSSFLSCGLQISNNKMSMQFSGRKNFWKLFAELINEYLYEDPVFNLD